MMAIIAKFENLKGILLENKSLGELCVVMESALSGKYSKQDFIDNKKLDLNNGIFALLQCYEIGRVPFFETHRIYVDFQLTISGGEAFLIGEKNDFTIKQDYDKDKDLIIYESSQKYHKILSLAGNLCIFFNHDVHAGGIHDERIDDKVVYKMVAKVPVELLKFGI